MLYLFLVMLLSFSYVFSRSPFSSLTITSTSAQCFPINTQKHYYCFIYKGSVKALFADESTLWTDCLKIIANNSKNNKKESSVQILPSQVNEVSMSGSVRLETKSDVISSDNAKILPEKNLCVLQNNVTVTHKKVKKGDLPTVLKSSRAEVNLVTKKVSFIGKTFEPVTTVIDLSSHISSKEKKVHHGENKNSFRARSS